MFSRRTLPALRTLRAQTPLTTTSLRPFSSLLTSRSSPPTTAITSTSTLLSPLTSTLTSAFNQSPSRQFSASASLAGKRITYNPSRRVQKRRHGFLARLRSRGGRKILMRRRQRGKKALSW
ncbi:mitochondrial 54S ribosomal protein bL34m [Aspergillus ruber CBS 135680]|uniref:Ribosomal protein L34-domain-containing protein n=1 Tax=Aspergillus ruber (strain CBS 135680) TaxID=1388766 RepID=A0A017SD97_ASPRC|nr:uncharacterized protein EURHEDRAFT_377789 [Aspergillus ruber CBS 135680]EYE94776.1 hypothetical protein EURHEDRAFT_377789 [Aspergillus ruber CBS 135680]